MKKNVLLTLSLLLLVQLRIYAQFNRSIGIDKVQFGRALEATNVDSGSVIAGKQAWDGISFGRGDALIVKAKPSGFIDWAVAYGGQNDEWFNSIEEIGAKSTPNLPMGYAAFGTSLSFTGAADAYFVRTDLSGAPLFSFVFGRDGRDFGHCLQYIKDHETGKYGYVMTGQTSSYPYFGSTIDIFVVKTDEFGNLIRATVMGGPGQDVAHWIEQTSDGGFIITGSTTSASCAGPFLQNKDIFVIRLDSRLNIVWNTIIGHEELPYEDEGFAILQDPSDGSFTLTGITKSFGVSERGDAFLINLDPMGGLNWMKTYGTDLLEQGNSIHLGRTTCGETEYVVAGVSFGISGRGDAWVFKTDRLGNLQWTTVYGTKDGAESAAEITDSHENGYIFTGSANAHFTIDEDIYLVKMDQNGKSGSCELRLEAKEIRQFPCITESLQQVLVDDLKRVETIAERIELRENRCDDYSAFSSGSNQDVIFDIMATPNPSKSSVTLRSSSRTIVGGEVKIYNREGVIVHSGTLDEETVTLNISSYPNGVYVIHIVTATGENVYGRFAKE